MTSTVTIKGDELEALMKRALEAANVNQANAASTARALTLAEIDGQKDHGLSRVPSYAAQARAGKVDGHAVPTTRRTRPGALMVDAAHGFAYPAFDLALPQLAELARETGIAAAGVARSHHFGVAGHHVERLAAGGLVAMAVGNTPKAIAPWGGRQPLFGTNTLAFAAPCGMPGAHEPPLVIDMALSQVTRGKILTHVQAGTPIPDGWAVDADGKPTTDPNAALTGSLAPIGGAKGSALALMVEVLAVAVTGSRLGLEASSFFDDQDGPPGVGQLVLAIDPAAFGGFDLFADRMTALAAAIAQQGARLPGSRRLEARRAAHRDGVSVDSAMLGEVRALAGG